MCSNNDQTHAFAASRRVDSYMAYKKKRKGRGERKGKEIKRKGKGKGKEKEKGRKRKEKEGKGNGKEGKKEKNIYWFRSGFSLICLLNQQTYA